MQVHKVPASEFDNNLTRFEVPCRAVAYSPDGRLLAAGCDDGTIKLIDVGTQHVRKAHV